MTHRILITPRGHALTVEQSEATGCAVTRAIRVGLSRAGDDVSMPAPLPPAIAAVKEGRA